MEECCRLKGIEMTMYTRQLRRQNGILGGVCGGIGAYYDINPWWLRIVFLIAAIPGGVPGILPYILFWIAIPKSKTEV